MPCVIPVQTGIHRLDSRVPRFHGDGNDKAKNSHCNSLITKKGLTMRVDIANTSAQYIKGVGPDRLKLLKRLGIFTVRDSLRYFPKRYEDRSDIMPISQLKPDIFQTTKGKVVSSSIFRARSGIRIFQLVVSDGITKLYCLWFRQPYMKNYFKEILY